MFQAYNEKKTRKGSGSQDIPPAWLVEFEKALAKALGISAPERHWSVSPLFIEPLCPTLEALDVPSRQTFLEAFACQIAHQVPEINKQVCLGHKTYYGSLRLSPWLSQGERDVIQPIAPNDAHRLLVKVLYAMKPEDFDYLKARKSS